MDCLRCGSYMRFFGSEQVQLGKGVWSNFLSGALEVTIYQCSGCGKIEFFNSEKTEQLVETPQRICPQCGFTHDFDYPKCPKCGYNYYRDR